MEITEIIVSAGRTFNHPYKSYSNLRPQVSLKAVLGPEDDPKKAVKALQEQAEKAVEDHKQKMLAHLEALDEIQAIDREVMSLEEQISRAQARLESVRTQQKALSEKSTQEDLF